MSRATDMTGEEIDMATIEALADRATKPIVTKVGRDLEGIGCTEVITTICQNALTIVTLALMAWL